MRLSWSAWNSLCQQARNTWLRYAQETEFSEQAMAAWNRQLQWRKMARGDSTLAMHPVTELYNYVYNDIAREGMTPGDVWGYEGPPSIEDLCDYLSDCYYDGSIGDSRPRPGVDLELDLMMKVAQILVNE